MSLSRRAFLRASYGTAGFVTLVTVGQTVSPLQRLGLLAPRRPDTGDHGFPVNRTAEEAHITLDVEASYRLTVQGPKPLSLSLADLQAMPQHQASLPIACVEGWSTMRTWQGVRVRDLLDQAGVPHDTRVHVESLEQGGAYRTSFLDAAHARDRLTLLALKVHGQVLSPDHGFPLRLIAADRPGVLQTKWVSKLSPA
jgi:DMSO/TMAO reductase YedYZ molybdopterin-dependent catalytic subunit